MTALAATASRLVGAAFVDHIAGSCRWVVGDRRFDVLKHDGHTTGVIRFNQALHGPLNNRGHILTGLGLDAFKAAARLGFDPELHPRIFNLRSAHTAIMRQCENLCQLNTLFDFVCTVWYNE